MSSIDSSPHSRRRLAAWLAFGAAGLATAGSPALTKPAPTTATSALSATTTAVTPLAFDWQGRWGSVAADTVMFKVDLSGAGFAGKTYSVALLLTNTSVLTGWASMQLEVERVDEAAAGSCTAADLDGTNNEQVLNFDDEDAGVYWNSLAGDAVYCIGLASSPGDDVGGTFLRAAQDTPPSAFPTFVATMDRAT